jgi:hypothetical protein
MLHYRWENEIDWIPHNGLHEPQVAFQKIKLDNSPENIIRKCVGLSDDLLIMASYEVLNAMNISPQNRDFKSAHTLIYHLLTKLSLSKFNLW